MISAVAIDVGWLMELDEAVDEDLMGRFRLIECMRQNNIPLLLDHEGRILSEYNLYLTAGTLGRKFFSLFNNKGRVLYYSGNLTNAIDRALDDDNFDPSDRPYVGVAHRCQGAYLTHEEKHRTVQRRALLLEVCGVVVGGWPDIQPLL